MSCGSAPRPRWRVLASSSSALWHPKSLLVRPITTLLSQPTLRCHRAVRLFSLRLRRAAEFPSKYLLYLLIWDANLFLFGQVVHWQLWGEEWVWRFNEIIRCTLVSLLRQLFLSAAIGEQDKFCFIFKFSIQTNDGFRSTLTWFEFVTPRKSYMYRT